MGGEGKDKNLESRIGRIVKAPLRFAAGFAKDYWVPAAFALGVGAFSWLYAAAAKGESPDFGKFASSTWKAIADVETWKSIAPWAAGFLGTIYGGLQLRNAVMKRKGKKPISLLHFTKQIFSPKRKFRGGYAEAIKTFPDSSLAHRETGRFYFSQGRIIEAMEAYYQSLKMRDYDFTPKIPVVGTNSYVNAVTKGMRQLEEKIRKEGIDNESLLELAMQNFLLYDFENAQRYFEMIDKEECNEEDAVAMHIIGSRLYSQIAEMAERPRMGRLSFGDSRPGRWLDKTFFFWRYQDISGRNAQRMAEQEAGKAASKLLSMENIEDFLEPIGGHKVYRVRLNSFVKAFVVLKEGSYSELNSELKIEKIFERTVAGGKSKSVHPIGIEMRKGENYLILLYEEGKPLAESRNITHFRDAMEFAARSDALMPTEILWDKEYSPKAHFKNFRIAKIRSREAREILEENCEFMFKYADAFPAVFDGDWRPDTYGNCLVNDEGFIIALDKQDKGVTIGPVTAARILNQGTSFEEKNGDEIKDGIIAGHYIKVYQDTADRGKKIDDPSLFLPASLASTIEKAVAAYCFTLDKPSQQDSARIFLQNALHAGKRLRTESGLKKFYSKDELKQCARVEEAIYEHLLAVHSAYP